MGKEESLSTEEKERRLSLLEKVSPDKWVYCPLCGIYRPTPTRHRRKGHRVCRGADIQKAWELA